MKTFTFFTIVVILLLTNQMFSQVNNKLDSRSDNPLHARIIPYSIQDEQFGHPSKLDIFKKGESRAVVNKLILENGFLLIEELWQDWDGSNWVNSEKSTYAYIVVGIGQLTDGIYAYSLSNNYPNPFNPSTKIRYSVPELSNVTLKVYDVLGSEVITLVNGEKPIGSYEVEFEATSFPSGIYFYKLQANEFTQVKKMILLK